ncbi:polysaccharide deacetylase family protein [Lysobacter pythonis]|uniref:Polysaccharide deacetylase family protein n=1 Tax=Solilutibacter pythonis TaxID=2483112 RepID=A0A3M2I4L5_9GAMM|nr:polysaccharide deacetylase family protein [Lysobacter pythonis]RMH94172.1 polysaccharide deacetylase family protein [Lysobacter pythonis]
MSGSRLRIFTYHNLAVPPTDTTMPKLYVEPDAFERQCRLLKRWGIRGVSMSEGLSAWRAGDAHRMIVLTFDDGYLDNLENAVPIMRRYGFSATCYVVSGALAGYNAWDAGKLGVAKPVMDETAVRAWLSAGFEIGSHTVNHPHLDQLGDEAALAELVESRTALGRLAGHEIAHFCYPYGDHTERTVELVRRAGYESAVTTRRGVARAGGDPLRLPRISINGGRGLFKYWLHAATPYSLWRR